MFKLLFLSNNFRIHIYKFVNVTTLEVKCFPVDNYSYLYQVNYILQMRLNKLRTILNTMIRDGSISHGEPKLHQVLHNWCNKERKEIIFI